jgi:hypothetical protein
MVPAEVGRVLSPALYKHLNEVLRDESACGVAAQNAQQHNPQLNT